MKTESAATKGRLKGDKSSAKKPHANNKLDAKEYGGRKDGLDPTRFGDWEKNGRCIDF